jgi:hypothetical protein
MPRAEENTHCSPSLDLRVGAGHEAPTSVHCQAVDPIEVIFRHLDRWRHLPAYALERRADVFFSVYLKGFVESTLGVPLEDEILPELPLKHGLVPAEHESAQSVKVDFALFPRDRERVLFVELKTDPRSRRVRQDGELAAARQAGFRRVVEGIREIILHSQAYQKYFHLARTLERLGFLRIPADIADYLYPEPRQGLTRRLRSIEVTPLDPRIEVLYLQPTAGGEPGCLGFEEFAEHLLIWREAAGAKSPGEVLDRSGPPARP